MENKFDFNKNLEFLINTTVDTSKAVEQDKILNSKEIQQKLRIGRSTLYELLKEPDFPTYKIGKKYYASEEEIEKWLVSKQSK